MKRILVGAVALASLWLGFIAWPQGLRMADGGMFWNEASLDSSQVVTVPGERHCPVMRESMGAMCPVNLQEGPRTSHTPPFRGSAIWEAAMLRCYEAGFTRWECEESVGDGEFT